MTDTDFDRAVRLHRGGQLPEAQSAYAALLARQPSHFDAAHMLGVTYLQMGDAAQAERQLRAALILAPDSAEAWSNLGNALRSLGRLDNALAAHDRALALRPDYPQALENSANVLRLLGRMEEALARYDRAVALRPDAETLYNRGAALEALARWPEAAADYQKALAARPDFPEALNNLGNVLAALRRPREALAQLDRAIALRPGYAQALVNRGNVRRDLMQFEQALEDYDAAIALNRREAFNERGILWREMGRFDEAEKDFASITNADASRYSEGAWNLGLTQLLTGDWARGWAGYDERLLRDTYIQRGIAAVAPRWSGEPLAGKRLLLWTEQGYGDMIQFVRFAPLLEAQGAGVTLLAPARMHHLLASASPTLKLVDYIAASGPFDFQIALMSVPRVLAITPDTVPAPAAYLQADSAMVALWQDRLADMRMKIGVAWQGNPDGRADLGRSLPLAALLPLTKSDARFISLQKGAGLEQWTADAAIEIPLPGFDDGPDAFRDTAAIISGLDLVITPDTAIAHLAGALGRPTWLMLKAVPDWRWLMARNDTVWYPAMRLYRQPKPGDWDSVVNAMAQDLRRLV